MLARIDPRDTRAQAELMLAQARMGIAAEVEKAATGLLAAGRRRSAS